MCLNPFRKQTAALRKIYAATVLNSADVPMRNWRVPGLISRTWHGSVPIGKKDGFMQYLNQTGVKEALELEGNRGVYTHVVNKNEYSHFFLCTIWNSWKDVIQYAGEFPHIAISYPEDDQYNLISDPIVIHQEVNYCGNPFLFKEITD